MAQRFSEDRKEEVRQATDLHELVSRYLDLKRSGRNFSACCPFHRERTPSFYVYPDTQRWKCYGCQKGGDVFAFVMEREGVEFPEALRMLARERGIELDRPSPAEDRARRDRDTLRSVNEWACRWFQGNLKGSPAATYLQERGLDGATALHWRLGYAPDSWDGLLNAASAAGFDGATLEAAGLARPRESGQGHYDTFRGRVMFPIADIRGRVVAFGARVLGEGEPKYLNSPETVLFHKSRTVFALDRARDAARESGALLVMEGYMDVIMSHRYGFRNAVAGLGTAFTPSHAEALRRHASSVVLVYDGDAAGRRAAARAAEILLAAELEARVALVPAGHDPCDLLVAEGAHALQEVLDGSREALDHLVDESIREHGAAGGAGTAAAVDGLVRVALSVPNRVRRVVLMRRIASGLGVPEQAVNHRARALGSAAPEAESERVPLRRSRSVSELGPARERMLVEAALVGEGLAARLADEVPTASFESPDLACIAEAVVSTATAEGTARPPACAARLAEQDREDLAECVAELASRGSGRDEASVLRQFDDCVAGLSLDRRIEEARRAFSAARASGDVEGESRWLADFQRLQTERVRATRPAKG